MRTNIEVVQELYAAFERGDADLLRRLLHTNVEGIQLTAGVGKSIYRR